MFSKKGREDKLPDLPPVNYSFNGLEFGESESEKESSEKHALPSFPDSPLDKGFSQAAIKDAVKGNLNSELPKLPELPSEDKDLEDKTEEKKSKVIEMEEWKPAHSIRVSKTEPAETHSEAVEVKRKSDFIGFKAKEIGAPDVFVKIDKFRSARRTFNDIKKKLEDIDSLISKIRETKLREEQELSAWEKEIMNIKSRVEEISENIFDKV